MVHISMAAGRVGWQPQRFSNVLLCVIMNHSCTCHVQVMYRSCTKYFMETQIVMYYYPPVLTMPCWHISENPFFSDCIIRDHPHYSLSSLLLLYHCINPNLRLLSLKVSFFSILKPDFSDLLHIFEPLEMINICM